MLKDWFCTLDQGVFKVGGSHARALEGQEAWRDVRRSRLGIIIMMGGWS